MARSHTTTFLEFLSFFFFEEVGVHPDPLEASERPGEQASEKTEASSTRPSARRVFRFVFLHGLFPYLGLHLGQAQPLEEAELQL